VGQGMEFPVTGPTIEHILAPEDILKMIICSCDSDQHCKSKMVLPHFCQRQLFSELYVYVAVATGVAVKENEQVDEVK